MSCCVVGRNVKHSYIYDTKELYNFFFLKSNQLDNQNHYPDKYIGSPIYSSIQSCLYWWWDKRNDSCCKNSSSNKVDGYITKCCQMCWRNLMEPVYNFSYITKIKCPSFFFGWWIMHVSVLIFLYLCVMLSKKSSCTFENHRIWHLSNKMSNILYALIT